MADDDEEKKPTSVTSTAPANPDGLDEWRKRIVAAHATASDQNKTLFTADKTSEDDVDTLKKKQQEIREQFNATIASLKAEFIEEKAGNANKFEELHREFGDAISRAADGELEKSTDPEVQAQLASLRAARAAAEADQKNRYNGFVREAFEEAKGPSQAQKDAAAAGFDPNNASNPLVRGATTMITGIYSHNADMAKLKASREAEDRAARAAAPAIAANNSRGLTTESAIEMIENQIETLPNAIRSSIRDKFYTFKTANEGKSHYEFMQALNKDEGLKDTLGSKDVLDLFARPPEKAQYVILNFGVKDGKTNVYAHSLGAGGWQTISEHQEDYEKQWNKPAIKRVAPVYEGKVAAIPDSDVMDLSSLPRGSKVYLRSVEGTQQITLRGTDGLILAFDDKKGKIDPSQHFVLSNSDTANQERLTEASMLFASKQTRRENRAADNLVKAVLRNTDANNDKIVDGGELKSYMTSLDRNRDGTLDRTELTASAAQRLSSMLKGDAAQLLVDFAAQAADRNGGAQASVDLARLGTDMEIPLAGKNPRETSRHATRDMSA